MCSEWRGDPLVPNMPQLRDLHRRLEGEGGYPARCTVGLLDVLEGNLPYKLWVSGSGLGWSGMGVCAACMHAKAERLTGGHLS